MGALFGVVVAMARLGLDPNVVWWPTWAWALALATGMCLGMLAGAILSRHVSAALLGAMGLVVASGLEERWTGEPAPRRPVWVIAIDGADWGQLKPLLPQLPNIRGLVEGGAIGELATLTPALSPVIWTTVATGHPPSQHGITDFLHSSGTPFTSNNRRTEALWDIAGAADREVSVIGWWVTWPVEEVSGTMVSQYSSVEQRVWKGSALEGLEDQTFPDDLEVAPTIRAGLASGRAAFDALEIEGDAESLYFVRWAFASDRIFGELAVQLWTDRTDLGLLYFGAPDVVAHKLCVGDATSARCRRGLAAAYGAIDEMLGRLLAARPIDSTVILVSDHGYQLGAPGHEWGPPGLVAIHGPAVISNQIHGASVYDIAPTVLALMGLPVGRDLDGQLLRTAVGGLPVAWTPTHELGRAYSTEPVEAASDDALRERLRALGYLDR